MLIELPRIGVAKDRARPRQRIGLAVRLILRLSILRLRVIRIVGRLVRAVAWAELPLLLLLLLLLLLMNILLIKFI